MAREGAAGSTAEAGFGDSRETSTAAFPAGVGRVAAPPPPRPRSRLGVGYDKQAERLPLARRGGIGEEPGPVGATPGQVAPVDRPQGDSPTAPVPDRQGLSLADGQTFRGDLAPALRRQEASM